MDSQFIWYQVPTAKELDLEGVFAKAGVVFCKKCREGYYDKDNRLSIDRTGLCFSCEHVEVDA